MSHPGFWMTMNLLVGKEFKRSGKDIMDDVQEWIEKIVVKKELSVEGRGHDKVFWPNKLKDVPHSSEDLFVHSASKEIEDFFKCVDLPKIECNFSHPYVRSRLEKLMGSNLVSLTDRDYMQRLQERILEDYEESMNKRIKTRESEEMERVKNLVLSGKIPLSQAPPEMANHPIMLIENYCNRLIAERRAKIKIPKVRIPTHLYLDDTPDPPSGLSIEKGHVFRNQTERLCHPLQRFLTDNDADDKDAVIDEYLFEPDEYDRLKYESPLIKELRNCQTVEEMYALADLIIGVLKTIEESKGETADDVAPPPLSA